jgi:hypothetical protein
VMPEVIKAAACGNIIKKPRFNTRTTVKLHFETA